SGYARSIALDTKSIYPRCLAKEVALPDRSRIRDKGRLKIPRPKGRAGSSPAAGTSVLTSETGPLRPIASPPIARMLCPREDGRMKFGIFYELQLPRPWQAGDEHRLYQNALEQIELADRLGYDHAWQVEHHFLEEYSHSPSPETFLAAASQRTKQIRLGHGIYQLTTNHPAA